MQTRENDTKMDGNCKNIRGRQAHIQINNMSAVDKAAGWNEPL